MDHRLHVIQNAPVQYANNHFTYHVPCTLMHISKTSLDYTQSLRTVVFLWTAVQIRDMHTVKCENGVACRIRTYPRLTKWISNA